MSSAICFNLDQSKILSSGNGIKDIADSGQSTQKVGLECKLSVFLAGNSGQHCGIRAFPSVYE